MSESNIILAIVGFSSAGKDTLAKYAHDNLGYNFVVSHSTRPMRAGESQGNPYYFINDNEMCSLFVQNKLIEAREYDSVYGKWFYAVSKDEIEESIYTPAKFKISNPPKDVEKIKIITVRAENMYDRMDPNYFGIQLRLTERGYYGLETEFAHPLIIRLFLDINEPIDERFIKEILEMRELQMPVHGGKTKKIDVDFKFISLEDKVDTISRREFMVRQFKAYSSRYKDNNEKWGTKDEAIYELEMPGLDKPVLAKTIPFLSSYLSLNDGFLGINTYMREDDMPCIQIFFSKKALNEEQIWKVLTREDWKIKQKDGEFKIIPAKIMFENKGKIL